jgi:hypothetical protein
MYIMQYNTGGALFRPVLAAYSPWHTKRVHLLLCVGLGSNSCWIGCACSCSSLAARSNSPRRKVHVCLSTVRPRSWDVSKGSCEHQEQYEAPSLIERLAATCIRKWRMRHTSSVPHSLMQHLMQLLHTSTPTRCRSLPILRVQPWSRTAVMCHTQQGSKSAMTRW